jgi:myo-inositol-1(or 4)-monophosphatase
MYFQDRNGEINMFKDRLNKALDIVKIAGMIAQERQQSIGHIEDKTSPMDVVTDIDRETQDLILKTLKKNFPEDITWGEESGYPLKDFSSTWVLDPIDGTTNYIHGLPLYSISLAYYHQGIPVIGVIDSPAFGETFFSERGNGAYLNGKSIQLSDVKDLRRSLLSTGFPHEQNRCDIIIPVYKHLLCRTQALRAIGSAALGIAYVACGRFEAYFQFGISFYDVAAGVCILEEAGGRVLQINEKPWGTTSRSIVAINPLIEQQLFDELNRFQIPEPEYY